MHKSESYDNFHSSVQILVKIIINFLNFCVFPIFVIFIKLDVNFSNLAKINVFFKYFIHFFGLIHLKKSDFSYKLRICDFSRKSGKLTIQIKDDYSINWKNDKIQKIYDNFR